ncbi:hypothetical protein JYU34_015537 [Plutella xylostella]|uniref:FP protein C-terminal domain-containing protein n=1 Tax=Plutella xylostella TaxID=51655 RepID=A0ABQ7Q7A5_PLUXY|nr:hypothetical protein JYU34_015537 [Plutella xylostella]
MYHSPKSTHQGAPSKSESDLINLEKEVSTQLHSPETFITQRAKRPRDSSNSNPSEFSDLKDMILRMMSSQSERMDNLEKHILDIKGQTTNIENTNSDIEKSMNHISDQMTCFEAKIAKLEKENKSLSAEIVMAQSRIDTIERSMTKLSIEIRDVPKQSNETKEVLYGMITQLSKTLNIPFNRSDIRDVSRSPSKKEQKLSTVVVEFTNTFMKSQYLNMAKDYNKKNKNNKLNNTHLGLMEPKSPIYIGELLTPAAKKLFYLTRTFVKESHFNYCWTTEGKIFIKENNDGPYFQIKSEDHLLSLKKKPISE